MTRRSITDISKEQEERAARFPPDRIAFKRGDWNVAVDDQIEFRRFKHGEISLDTLRRLIGQNNHLPEITREQMLNELKETGWI